MYDIIEPLILSEELIYTLIPEYPIYGSINEADRYFGLMLHGELWDRTDYLKKYKSLVTATKAINDLRYVGYKTDPDQTLEFPRFGDTDVPSAIKEATFEVALALLKGIDSESEYDNLFVTSRVFGSIRTDYNRSSVPDHKKAGIPSLRAWQLLLPYMKPALDLRLRRVD